MCVQPDPTDCHRAAAEPPPESDSESESEPPDQPIHPIILRHMSGKSVP